MEKQIGTMITGDFEENTMVIKIEGEMWLRAGVYAVIAIEELDNIKTDSILPHFTEFFSKRKAQKLSMDIVSKATGVPKSTISRLERGRDTYYSAAKKLNDFYIINSTKK